LDPPVRDNVWFPTQTMGAQLRVLKQKEEHLAKIIEHITKYEAPEPIGPAKEQSDAPAVHESTDQDAESDTDQFTDDDDAW